MKLVTTETVHWWMQICKLQSQKWKNKLLIIKGQTQFLPWQMPCQILWHCCPQTRGYCMCVVFSITWPTFSWFTLLPKLFFLSLSVLLFYPSLRWSRAEKGLYCKSGFILTRLKKSFWSEFLLPSFCWVELSVKYRLLPSILSLL